MQYFSSAKKPQTLFNICYIKLKLSFGAWKNSFMYRVHYVSAHSTEVILYKAFTIICPVAEKVSTMSTYLLCAGFTLRY